MSPQEIVASKDFLRLVTFAYNRYNLDRFIELEELTQETALHILKHGAKEGLKISTVVVQHCIWAVGRGRIKKRISYLTNCKREEKENKAYNHKGCEDVDNAEVISKLLSMLNGKRKRIFELKLQGFSNAEIAKQLLVSHQTICDTIKRVKAEIYPIVKGQGDST